MTMEVPTELVLAHRKRIMFRLQVILWIVWAFILLSGLFFTLTIALVLTHPRGDAPPPPDARQIMVLFVVAVVEAVVGIGVIRLIRLFILHRAVNKWSWRGFAIWYVVCKLLTWFFCNGATFFCLVICLIARSFLPALPLAALLWLCIAADLPLLWTFKKYELKRYAMPTPR